MSYIVCLVSGGVLFCVFAPVSRVCVALCSSSARMFLSSDAPENIIITRLDQMQSDSSICECDASASPGVILLLHES